MPCYSAQVNPLTAYCLLEVLNIPKGGYIVFSAAGSALSRMGIHLAKHSGLKTIGIVRRDEQREELQEHGCHAVISSASEDVVSRIKEITGGEVVLLIMPSILRTATELLSLLLQLLKSYCYCTHYCNLALKSRYAET
jgi:NADPH:quinone reductase-like Zn-dependent oxidoreductase